MSKVFVSPLVVWEAGTLSKKWGHPAAPPANQRGCVGFGELSVPVTWVQLGACRQFITMYSICAPFWPLPLSHMLTLTSKNGLNYLVQWDVLCLDVHVYMYTAYIYVWVCVKVKRSTGGHLRVCLLSVTTRGWQTAKQLPQGPCWREWLHESVQSCLLAW